MSKLVAALLLSIAAFSAGAAPVVAGGSSYSVYLSGYTGSGVDNAIFMTNAFDGAAQVFARVGQNVTVNDSETVLGGGQYRITLHGTATSDMFPVAGEGGWIGVGTDGNGLDLLMNVYLVDARIRFYSGASEVFSTTNLADDYRAAFFSGAWSGLFPKQNGVFSVGNLGGSGVDGFELDFLVSDLDSNAVPEPGAPALAFAGMLAMLAVARKRSRKEAGAATRFQGKLQAE